MTTPYGVTRGTIYKQLLEDFMNHKKTRRDGPNQTTIVLRENTGNAAQPVHDLAGLDRNFRNAFLEDFGQILGNLFGILAIPHPRGLEPKEVRVRTADRSLVIYKQDKAWKIDARCSYVNLRKCRDGIAPRNGVAGGAAY